MLHSSNKMQMYSASSSATAQLEPLQLLFGLIHQFGNPGDCPCKYLLVLSAYIEVQWLL